MDVQELQRSLRVPADGVYGPLTRGALEAALTGDPTPLQEADFSRAAARLNCEPAAIMAVALVETGREGAFDPSTKRPVILFEPHVFSRETGGDFDASHPSISYTESGSRAYPRSQMGRWNQLHRAMALDPEAALNATSWGQFQIMGFNARPCGFHAPLSFVRSISRSSAAQLDAFVTFLIRRGLDDELKDRRWAAFARGYNGPAFVRHDYDGRLADAYWRAAG